MPSGRSDEQQSIENYETAGRFNMESNPTPLKAVNSVISEKDDEQDDDYAYNTNP